MTNSKFYTKNQSRPKDNASFNQFLTLCDLYKKLKNLQSNIDPIFHPRGEWSKQIARKLDFFNLIFENNFDEAFSRAENFWRDNHLGSFVKQIASFQDVISQNDSATKLSETIKHELNVWSHLTNRKLESLEISSFGNIWGLLTNDIIIGPKCVRYNMLEWQVSNLLNACEGKTVYELGAGYGGFANFYMAADQNRTYVNFDLPETLFLCCWYLTNTLKNNNVRIALSKSDLLTFSKEPGVVLAPNWLLPDANSNSCDVFLNTFSLSEVGQDVLKIYCENIERVTRSFFFHNNMDRKGVVNDGVERVPGSHYPISPSGNLRLISKDYDKFQTLHFGRDGDYREFIYLKV